MDLGFVVGDILVQLPAAGMREVERHLFRRAAVEDARFRFGEDNRWLGQDHHRHDRDARADYSVDRHRTPPSD